MRRVNDEIHDIKNNISILKILLRNLQEDYPKEERLDASIEALQRLGESFKQIQKD